MKYKLLFFVLIIFGLIIGCNANHEEEVKDPYITLSSEYLNDKGQYEISLYKDNILVLEYETNLKNIVWESSDEDIATIVSGTIYGLSEGLTVVTASYNDKVYFEILVFVEKKPFQPTYYNLIIDGDVYNVRGDSYLSVNLEDYFNGATHIDYDDASFVGWYLDKELTIACDLDMKVTSDMEIYSKYRSLEIVSNLRIMVDSIVKYKSTFRGGDVVTFSPAYGTYVNNDLTEYTVVSVQYDYIKLDYYVTSITEDGTKADMVIPADGFIIAIKKGIDNYQLYLDNLKKNAKVTLSKYSVNTANIIYVNETVGEFTNDFNANGLALVADYVSVYDARNKQTLYSAKGDTITYPASVTKIMTVIVGLKYAHLEDELVVGDELDVMWEGSSPSRAGLVKGQKWTLRQLLYATMLPSGNDGAYSVAALTINSMYPNNTMTAKEKIAKFAELMNLTAKEIGTTSTHFMTPDGNSYYKDKGTETVWDERIYNHYVTANDMVKIANYAFSFGAIAEVCSTKSISFNIVSRESFSLTNTNALIKSTSSYYCSSAVGLKTGTTNPAGACLISAVEINRRFIIVSVLHSSGNNRYVDSLKLYRCIFGSAIDN